MNFVVVLIFLVIFILLSGIYNISEGHVGKIVLFCIFFNFKTKILLYI